jgi:hypothetical protein
VRGKTDKIQSPISGYFTECQVTLVDIEPVLTLQAFVVPDLANVQIQKAIAVYICHGHASGPATFASYLCRFGDILKLEVSLVEVQFVAALVAGKINVHQAIIVDVPERYPATVVEIQVLEDIKLRSGLEGV